MCSRRYYYIKKIVSVACELLRTHIYTHTYLLIDPNCAVLVLICIFSFFFFFFYCFLSSRRPSSGDPFTDHGITLSLHPTTRIQNHLPANHQRPMYACARCGNSYARLHSLSRHVRFECGVDPKFECPICHKKSKHKHNLLLHMKTHLK